MDMQFLAHCWQAEMLWLLVMFPIVRLLLSQGRGHIYMEFVVSYFCILKLATPINKCEQFAITLRKGMII